jgi:universal stress protein A
MAEWKKICCAVDLSESSRAAMEEAADLARRFQAELTVLHVYEVPSAVEKRMEASTSPAVEQAVLERQRVLDTWRANAERIAGRPVCSSVVPGHAALEITGFVRDGGFDLLVVGTHGRHGLERLVLGSVAERLVREVTCPVLVLRGARAAAT